ncbi:hypothetical protein SKAU_G00117210 [Synaphobranchus kaupii]|uniref:Uncharacterized protein n=1 Tax=Synaphobranchus kaupii TaxID=118154 RepID=A0A9Q1FMV6_SYNKA|nr:hypothetical protein SKAU_G00117210 [Synaphobranchus kaupii]
MGRAWPTVQTARPVGVTTLAGPQHCADTAALPLASASRVNKSDSTPATDDVQAFQGTENKQPPASASEKQDQLITMTTGAGHQHSRVMTGQAGGVPRGGVDESRQQ